MYTTQHLHRQALASNIAIHLGKAFKGCMLSIGGVMLLASYFATLVTNSQSHTQEPDFEATVTHSHYEETGPFRDLLMTLPYFLSALQLSAFIHTGVNATMLPRYHACAPLLYNLFSSVPETR